MSKICVIGTGYVGLVTGTCFADLGNHVICLDVDENRIQELRQGIMPIYEPGLEQLVIQNVRAGRLVFSTDYAEALEGAEFAFIAVGTPSGVDGEADLQYVRSAAEGIADIVQHPIIVINKSTVPVGTGDWVSDIIRKRRGAEPLEFSVVSNPEFLREGSAINDFMYPDRVVLGSLHSEAAQRVAMLYVSLRCPIMITDLRTAEMIKYASNAFLATRISFINEIANICDELGADVREVRAAWARQAHWPGFPGCRHRLGRQLLPQRCESAGPHGGAARHAAAAAAGGDGDQPQPAPAGDLQTAPRAGQPGR
jgi:UDPglucose 6-dehydrogenase